jgi:hypothetical protein
MVALGLWGAVLGPPALWVLPVAFPMVMACGVLVGLLGVPLPGVEIGIAASGLVIGLMVLFVLRPPLGVAALLVATFALFHGYAHGAELPPGGNALLYSLAFVIATGLLHLLGILLGEVRRWPGGHLGVRTGGAGPAPGPAPVRLARPRVEGDRQLDHGVRSFDARLVDSPSPVMAMGPGASHQGRAQSDALRPDPGLNAAPLIPNGGIAPLSGRSILVSVLDGVGMAEATFNTKLTIGELEAHYHLYCKALRILVRERKTLNQIQRSVCWDRLLTLYRCLPRHYKDPQQLYLHLKRELDT